MTPTGDQWPRYRNQMTGSRHQGMTSDYRFGSVSRPSASRRADVQELCDARGGLRPGVRVSRPFPLHVDHLRRQFGPGEERSPVLHHATPLLQHIAATVRCLDLVADGVGQRHFRHVTRVARALGAPSRKVDRNPCGTAATAIRRVTATSVLSDSTPPLGAENTSSVPAIRG